MPSTACAGCSLPDISLLCRCTLSDLGSTLPGISAIKCATFTPAGQSPSSGGFLPAAEASALCPAEGSDAVTGDVIREGKIGRTQGGALAAGGNKFGGGRNMLGMGGGCRFPAGLNGTLGRIPRANIMFRTVFTNAGKCGGNGGHGRGGTELSAGAETPAAASAVDVAAGACMPGVLSTELSPVGKVSGADETDSPLTTGSSCLTEELVIGWEAAGDCHTIWFRSGAEKAGAECSRMLASDSRTLSTSVLSITIAGLKSGGFAGASLCSFCLCSLACHMRARSVDSGGIRRRSSGTR